MQITGVVMLHEEQRQELEEKVLIYQPDWRLEGTIRNI
jgi:hypothetical protein